MSAFPAAAEQPNPGVGAGGKGGTGDVGTGSAGGAIPSAPGSAPSAMPADAAASPAPVFIRNSRRRIETRSAIVCPSVCGMGLSPDLFQAVVRGRRRRAFAGKNRLFRMTSVAQ
jgi:hypothetical protein